MSCWKTRIDTRAPAWEDYRNLLGQLTPECFPDTRDLNRLLPREISSLGDAAIRFVPASRVPGVQYEKHIFETGEVSTRENSWHDLFNALVWCRMPRLKTAMNARHCQEMEREAGGRRGKIRDALTLFDESGVIVTGSNFEALRALASRDWRTAFLTHRDAWRSELNVLVCGHALLEKFLDPYKAITAHSLVLFTAGPASPEQLDEVLGNALVTGRLFDSPDSLSPLPLMGLPGWWPGGDQDRRFYYDNKVFRPAPTDLAPAPLRRLENL